MLIWTLFARAPVGVFNATVAKPADGSFEHYDEAKIQPSSSRPVKSISKRWGCERPAGFSDSSQDGLSLVGPSCPVTPSKPTTDNCRLRHYLSRLLAKGSSKTCWKFLCFSKLKTMLDAEFWFGKTAHPLIKQPLSSNAKTSVFKCWKIVFQLPSLVSF